MKKNTKTTLIAHNGQKTTHTGQSALTATLRVDDDYETTKKIDGVEIPAKILIEYSIRNNEEAATILFELLQFFHSIGRDYGIVENALMRFFDETKLIKGNKVHIKFSKKKHTN